ncbi:hypothetical protein [Nakamurella lactea]|uniref:hypothetical protein n=1 Tax=Nakamurella lactea TaxID=459515 RepID=UPI000414AD6D|nr:hypothetical protein [Nakamurella lactea]
MGRTRSGLIIGALVATAFGTISGCSGTGAGEGSTPSSGSAPVAGPLDEYLGGGTKPEDDEKAKAQQHQVQELVASCMKEQGFTYIPFDAAMAGTVTMSRESNSVADRDWTAKYGYGITTTNEVKPSEDQKDPNQAAMEKMSASERKAYQKALFGSAGASLSVGGGGAVVAIGPGGPGVAGSGTAGSGTAGSGTASSGTTGSGTTGSGTTGSGTSGSGTSGSGTAGAADVGCYGTAQTKVFGNRQQIDTSDFDDLFKALDDLHQRVDADPRVAPLIKAWASCLADAGHPGYTKITDPQDSIMKKWADLNGWDFQRGERGVTVGGPAAGGTGTDAPPAPDQQKTADLRKEEIALALADFDCRKDYRTTYDAVRVELEKAFVVAHKAELERYRDAMNGGR